MPSWPESWARDVRSGLSILGGRRAGTRQDLAHEFRAGRAAPVPSVVVAEEVLESDIPLPIVTVRPA
jgi:hypothetical protein